MGNVEIDFNAASRRAVYLRPVERGDLDFTRQHRQAPEIRAATLGRVFPVTPENESRWYEGLGVGEYPTRVALIACSEDHARVGAFFLGEINWISRTAWLGIWVPSELQGNGYGRAILEEGMTYAYASLGLRQIRLEVARRNERAIGLYSAVGFVEEGCLSQAAWINGELQDVLVMRHVTT